MPIIQRHQSTVIGLVNDLSIINGNITDVDTASAKIAANLSDLADAATARTNLDVYSTAEVTTAISTEAALALKIASNLSDLNDVPTARTNLDIDSKAEVTAKITAAKLALGTNFVVADITERDTLTAAELTTGDMVHVIDDGDTKWAKYMAVDTAGVISYVKIADQDALENAISAASIKSSYESNADTNAFTDAEAAKLTFISVTSAIDLDKVIQNDELATDLSVAVTDVQIPSALAVKSYADAALASGAALAMSESLVVSGDNITLTNTPVSGVNGVLNYGTVRYVDGGDGATYDAPITGIVGNVATIGVNNAGDWNGNTVQIQYLYTAV